jgi:hypothetical protein
MLKTIKNVTLLATIFLSLTVQAIVNVKINKRGRRAAWDNFTEGYTWDHIIPYTNCVDAFVNVMKRDRHTSDQKNYLMTLRDSLDKYSPFSSSEDPEYIKERIAGTITEEQHKKCAEVRSKISTQIRIPGGSHGSLDLSWEDENDLVVLTELFYANGNGCYHRNGHGGRDLDCKLDLRMLTDTEKGRIDFECAGRLSKFAAGNAEWCKGYTTLLGLDLVKAWEVRPCVLDAPRPASFSLSPGSPFSDLDRFSPSDLAASSLESSDLDSLSLSDFATSGSDDFESATSSPSDLPASGFKKSPDPSTPRPIASKPAAPKLKTGGSI